MGTDTDIKGARKLLASLVFTQKSVVEPFRSNIEERFAKDYLPNRVVCEERSFGAVDCDILTPVLYSKDTLMLYIHGGSFIGGSRASWRSFCASLSSAAALRTIVPEIRLAPTSPYPAAVDDVKAVVRSLVDIHSVIQQPKIVVAADGSGACILIAAILALEPYYRKSLAYMLLLSPWLKLNYSGLSRPTLRHSTDKVLSLASIYRSANLYTYSSNLDSPKVVPLRASAKDYLGFPATYIQVGAKEVLLEQCKDFAAILEEANVECQIEAVPDMCFCFQMADEYLPQSSIAVEKLGKLLASLEGALD